MSDEAPHDASRSPAAPPGPAALCDASTNLSHTNVAQVTAGSAPENAKWTCEVCTYENFPLSRKCTMCRTPKPSLGEDIFKLQDGASALPSHEHCGAESVAERLRPLRISSPHEPAGASAQHKWACPTCTYENWPKSLKCAMCGAEAGGPPPTPSLVEPRPHRITKALTPGEVCGGTGSETENARRSKRRNNNPDWIWLQACLGVVEGDTRRVEAYLSGGGDPARALSAAEVALLDRASAFDAGHTLVHLAIRFQRQDILAALLARISGGGPGLKRSPSYIAPELASIIRRHLASCIRQKKGSFPCRYINEFCTFSLPAEITLLPGAVQEQLFSELLDREAQVSLEQAGLLNWSGEVCALGSRLYALWNRSAGDCLPDAVCQAAYGVFDRRNSLRGAVAESLQAARSSFYPRWAASERRVAAACPAVYAPHDDQLRADWAALVAAAATPGQPLQQVHVFALAHVMRRPIIVYGVDVIHSFRGEALGYAHFQGIYLPLLWEHQFCSKSPLCVAYTRGHFSALVPLDPYTPSDHYICREQPSEPEEDVTFLPLTDAEGKLLPVHFLTADEVSMSQSIVRRWVSWSVTEGGVVVARQAPHARPLAQAQMVQEWINHYRRLAEQSRGPFPARVAPPLTHCCSDHEHDTDTE